MKDKTFEMHDVSPCVACVMAERCKAKLTACKPFLSFVINNKYDASAKRMPTKQIYTAIFNPDSKL